MIDPRPLDPPEYWLSAYEDMTEEELADAYRSYLVDLDNNPLHPLIVEIQRRGMWLTDLEDF